MNKKLYKLETRDENSRCNVRFYLAASLDEAKRMCRADYPNERVTGAIVEG